MPVRVLCVGNMYPPHHLGGYELVWQRAVEHLRERGHDVAVLTTDHREPGVEAGDEAGVHRDLSWWWRDHDWPRRSLRERLRLERRNAAAFDRLLARFRPEAVTWWAMGGMSLSLLERARRAGLRSAAFVHDDWVLYGPRADGWTRMFRRRPRLGSLVDRQTGISTRFAPEAVDAWWFVSARMRDRALSAGLPLRHTGVAPSGIDPAFLGPAPPRPWEGRLLYVGRIDERKGTSTAVRALASLPAGTTLTVVGEGDARHRSDLRALMDRLDLDGRVRLESGRPRDELADLYDAHDAVVFPVTWEEPWGLVPLEAMARGRPVLATGRGGSGEYLRDTENCLLFQAGDPVALAAGVQRLAAGEDLRARLREGGTRTAREHTDDRFHAAVAAAVEDLARPLSGTP